MKNPERKELDGLMLCGIWIKIDSPSYSIDLDMDVTLAKIRENGNS